MRLLHLRTMQQKKHSKGSPPLNAAAGSRPFRKPYTKLELSEHATISVRSIEEEVNKGHLRAVYICNRTVRFLPEDVDAWLNRRASIAAEEQVPA